MALNENSFSTESNCKFGASNMKDMWWNVQTFQLPAISMSPPKVNGRSGAMINLAPDVVDYDDLTLDVILDKSWVVYTQLYEHFIKRLSVENAQFVKEGTFDLWIEMYDGEGKMQKKIWFYRCRLTTFGDMTFDMMSSEDELNTMSLSFVYDYFEFDDMYKNLEMAPDE